MMNIDKIVSAVEQKLNESRLFAEVYQYLDLPVVCVQINWGDWKHDHLRADHLIKQIGGNLFSEQVTDSDGSDCYSSRHNYMFPEGLIET